eukprot:209486-Rhodomonas_salina.2
MEKSSKELRKLYGEREQWKKDGAAHLASQVPQPPPQECLRVRCGDPDPDPDPDSGHAHAHADAHGGGVGSRRRWRSESRRQTRRWPSSAPPSRQPHVRGIALAQSDTDMGCAPARRWLGWARSCGRWRGRG